MTDLFNVKMNNEELRNLSSLALAHIGDAVFEIMVRTWLCVDGRETATVLHKASIKYVSAVGQADAFDKISSSLSEEEMTVYKRARNTKVNSIPVHATVGQYHIATGIEALFGYLYLTGKKDRLNELFAMITENNDAT